MEEFKNSTLLKVIVGLISAVVVLAVVIWLSAGNKKSDVLESTVASNESYTAYVKDETTAKATEKADNETKEEESGEEKDETTAQETSEDETTEDETPEETTAGEPSEDAVAVSISAEVVERNYQIGHMLSDADLTITVNMSDGTKLTNPPGWGAYPLELKNSTNEILIQYGELFTNVTIDAAEPPTYSDSMTYVFLGDSRFEGINYSTDEPNDVFYAESGEGYHFLERIKEEVIAAGNENCALIIGLGVNDGQYFIPEYIASINDIAARYPGKVYWTTVNPVDEIAQVEHGYAKSNAVLANFNAQVSAALSSNITIIDTCTYLSEVGASWVDGLHFTSATNVVVYNYIKSKVSETF